MTDKDLKQIRTIVREEVQATVPKLIEDQLKPIKKKLETLATKNGLTKLEKKVDLINEKADGILKYADEIEKATDELDKRVYSIEQTPTVPHQLKKKP